MRTVLFLPSSPHHTLWCLALAAGPFRDARCVLAQTNWRADHREYLVETLRSRPCGLFAELTSFPKLVLRPRDRLLRARRLLASISRYARDLAPGHVVTGNDYRAEFHAALRGAPGAIGTYVDDGWGSYRNDTVTSGAAGTVIDALKAGSVSAWRWLSFGVRTGRPGRIGGSAAVREAWVMAPALAHDKLAPKTLHAIEPAWLHDPRVLDTCTDAIRRSGLAAEDLDSVGLVLLLPHDEFLRRHPELRAAMERRAQACAARGELLAYKHHPRSRAQGLALPRDRCVEIPQRLPVEILAPFLRDTLVVGVMTSALIFLPRLQPRIRVEALIPSAAHADPVTRIYRSMGVHTLDLAGNEP